MTTVAPPANVDANSQNPDSQYPDAVPAPVEAGPKVSLDSAGPQTYENGHYILNDHVVLTYKGRTLRADHMEYDQATGDVTLTGHIVADGGDNDEHIEASRGAFNIRTETGRFYDVTGSIGVRRPSVGPMSATARAVYANSNPFLFTARVLIKDGPHDYAFDHGTFTSCQLPRPDWLLSATRFRSDGTTARAGNTVFHLL
ncbi:MAG TPA: LPS-assembly protein LptD, partial [Acidobacteriaceae bacterium]